MDSRTTVYLSTRRMIITRGRNVTLRVPGCPDDIAIQRCQAAYLINAERNRDGSELSRTTY